MTVARNGFPVWQVVLALLLLRISIGLHFFGEGLSKIRSGSFTAAPFLSAATGPWAPWFHQLVDDPDGAELLCVRKTDSTTTDGGGRVAVDPERTIALWNDFADRCQARYGFGDPGVARELADQRRILAGQLERLADEPAAAAARQSLGARIAELDRQAGLLASQPAMAAAIVRSHVERLRSWLDENRTALIAHFSTAGRERAFERDGAAGSDIASAVAGLRDQTRQIRTDRTRQRAAWAAEVRGLWDSLEQSLNGLAFDVQRRGPPLRIHRPHDQPGSPLKWINAVIPWFDLTIGVLLMLGIFPRLAALAGALFLLSVVATQPPWVPDAAPVWSQWIEMSALLVLATPLGRTVPGAGWLLGWRPRAVAPGLARSPA